ncbi:MAG: glycosyltransferase family 2 protein [Opitutales bacterium]|nr:glycosyltransferase family 2 protein [Opitutales bacterium]
MEHIIDPKFFCHKKLTFAVPCYNHENYISECLDSILAQKLNVPFDILVCDDASTDNTPNVLREYLRKYPDKIKVIFLEKNGGNLHTLNTLFNHIKSEYFYVVDSDDYLLGTHFVQKALDFLEIHPDYTMYGGNCIFLKQGRLKGHYMSGMVLGLSFSWNDICSHINFQPQTSCLLYRNIVFLNGATDEFLQAENTFDRFVYCGENLRILRHLQKGNIFIPSDNVSVYRVHEGGVLRGKSLITGFIRQVYVLLHLSRIFPDYKNFYESLFFFHYPRVLKAIYKNRANPNYLRQEDCDLLKEIYRLLPTADLDWSKLKWHSFILIKCFYRAKTYAYLLCRQMYRILSRKQIV